MNDTESLIKALWIRLKRERRHPTAAESLAFRSQYYTDTLPLELQVFKAKAVEMARNLPDSTYENGEFDIPEICLMNREEILVWLKAYTEEAEQRDIPDPEDWDQDLEDELDDWDEEKNDFIEE